MHLRLKTITTVLALGLAFGCEKSVDRPAQGAGPDAGPSHKGHAHHHHASGDAKPHQPPNGKPPVFIALDAKPKTVNVLLIATYDATNHGMNFNGFSHGKASYIVPVGWTVNVHFKNASPVPHSAVVVEQDALEELQIGEAYFDGATTPNPTLATTPKEAKFSFVADEAGNYAFACGFPTHAAHGHWLGLVISQEAKTPALKLPDQTLEAKPSHNPKGS